MTLDWHTPLSFEPMMYAVAIGKTRFSLDMVRHSKAFVVNFMSKDFEKKILYCGTHTGKNIDKFAETGLIKEQAKSVDCPRIKQALAWLECKVEKEIEVGDHWLFIATVSHAEIREKGKRLFHLHDDVFTTTVD